MHFQSTSMNEKDPLSRCFQQIGHMFLRFEFTNQLNFLKCITLFQAMVKCILYSFLEIAITLIHIVLGMAEI